MTNQEIDRLVATEIMGFTPVYDDGDLIAFQDQPNERSYFMSDDDCEFTPSTYIGDAWGVVEKLNVTCNICKFRNMQPKYKVNFHTNSDRFVEYAESAPLAICLAALKAVGVEIQK